MAFGSQLVDLKAFDSLVVANTRKEMRRKPVGRRSLSVEEVAEVWYGGGISLPSHLALKLLIATGQRVEEVLQARWGNLT